MQTLPSCSDCYEQAYPECSEHILVAGGFSPSTIYMVTVNDQFGNMYRTSVAANAAGELNIPTADFPQGLFSRFSGPFEFLFWSEDGCLPFKPTICDEVRDCLLINFVQTTDSPQTEARDVVGCCTPETPEEEGSLVMSITQICLEGSPFTVFAAEVSGGDGSFIVQRRVGTTWLTIHHAMDYPQNGNFTLDPLSVGDLEPHSYRLLSGELVSNVTVFQLESCAEILDLMNVEYSCAEGAGSLHVTYTILEGEGNLLSFQVLIGGVWTTIHSIISAGVSGQSSSSFPYDIPATDSYTFRILDEFNGAVSDELEVEIPACEIVEFISATTCKDQTSTYVTLTFTVQNPAGPYAVVFRNNTVDTSIFNPGFIVPAGGENVEYTAALDPTQLSIIMSHGGVGFLRVLTVDGWESNELPIDFAAAGTCEE